MARIDPPPIHTPLVDRQGMPTRAMGDWMQAIWRRLKGQDLPEVTNSTATTVTELRTDFNNLLSALRNAGVIR
jgi:hypothetical protein